MRTYAILALGIGLGLASPALAQNYYPDPEYGGGSSIPSGSVGSPNALPGSLGAPGGAYFNYGYRYVPAEGPVGGVYSNDDGYDGPGYGAPPPYWRRPGY